MSEAVTAPFKVGDRVAKTGGDYQFEGEVVAAFEKRTGQVRYVVENDDGLLFIFAPRQIGLKPPPAPGGTRGTRVTLEYVKCPAGPDATNSKPACD